MLKVGDKVKALKGKTISIVVQVSKEVWRAGYYKNGLYQPSGYGPAVRISKGGVWHNPGKFVKVYPPTVKAEKATYFMVRNGDMNDPCTAGVYDHEPTEKDMAVFIDENGCNEDEVVVYKALPPKGKIEKTIKLVWK